MMGYPLLTIDWASLNWWQGYPVLTIVIPRVMGYPGLTSESSLPNGTPCAHLTLASGDSDILG